MLQKPNTVFVGPNVDLTASTLTTGEIFVANANTGEALNISSTTSIATALGASTKIKIGYKKTDGTITYSPEFSKDEVTNLLTNVYSAKSEATTLVDLTSATAPVVGHRYVVRCIYKDIYEHPGQFTHSYEVIATDTNIDTLATKFATRINAHAGARVTAYSAYFAGTPTGGSAAVIGVSGAVTGDVTIPHSDGDDLNDIIAAFNVANPTMTAVLLSGAGTMTVTADITVSAGKLYLVAKEVTPNGFGTQGKEAITLYSQVMPVVVTFTTIVDSRFNSAKASYGAVITTTTGKPGKGNPYIIRDREQAALAYKGITNRITWPIIKPELNVNLSETYDELIIELKKKYQSPDNQYEKETKLAIECYVENGATSTAANLYDKLAAWIA